MKFDTKSLLKNKAVLYVVFFIAVTNVFGYLMIKNYEAVMLFTLVGFLAKYFSKNMIIILGISILVTNLWISSGIKLLNEGVDDTLEKDEEEQEEEEGEETDENVKCDQTDPSGNCTNSFTNMKPLNPATVDGDDSVGPNLDYAGSLEAAYDNLDKLLDSDAMKRMGSDTEKLAQKQKKLMSNIGKLQPLMNTASAMLEKLNLIGNGSSE